MFAEPLGYYIFSEHALRQMAARGLPRELVEGVLAGPEQRLEQPRGRAVLQARVAFGARTYLVRVVADVDRQPAEIVTAYRTSAVRRYWRPEG